jgi:drug/metabolite transporter (DMT)-like permease
LIAIVQNIIKQKARSGKYCPSVSDHLGVNIYRYRALIALTAAGVAWGTTVPLSKIALEWVAPGWLAFIRFGLAALVLMAVLLRRAMRDPERRRVLRSAFRLPVLASGALGYGGSVVLQNAGIARTSVTHAALLAGAAPVLVAIIAFAWHRTVARPVAWAGFAVSLAGVGVITGGHSGGASLAGDTMILVSVVLMASATVVQSRLLEGLDPVALTAAQFVGAAAVTLPIAAATSGVPALPAGTGASTGMIVSVLGLAAGGTLLPFTLYAYGQRYVPSEVAGAFLNLEPFVGAVAGILLFGDPAGPRQVIGGTAILAGIVMGSLPGLLRGRPAAVPAPARSPVPAPAPAPSPSAARSPAAERSPAAAAVPALAPPSSGTGGPGPLAGAALLSGAELEEALRDEPCRDCLAGAA